MTTSLITTAGLDEARGRIRLTPDQLLALGRVARDEPVGAAEDAAAVHELQAAGILDQALRLHPLAADLAWTSAVPQVRMVVETSCTQGESAASVVIADEAVWYSEPWPGAGTDAAVAYQRAELPTIVWDLGRLVGLHRSQVREDAGALALPVGVLDGVLTLISAGSTGWDDTRVVALARGRELWEDLPQESLDRWLGLVASLRSWWRITVGWGETDRAARTDRSVPGRWLSVLDCGPEGYWCWEVPDSVGSSQDVAAGATVRLLPVSGGEIWKRIGELLPTAGDLTKTTGD